MKKTRLVWIVFYHTCTVERECCKGDDETLWERGKFDPPRHPKTPQPMETRAPILTQNKSNDAVPRKKVPFGGRETNI